MLVADLLELPVEVPGVLLVQVVGREVCAAAEPRADFTLGLLDLEVPEKGEKGKD